MQENDFNYSQEIEQHLTIIAKQSGIVFTGKLIGYILGLISNFVLARFYGPKILGQFALVLATVNIISIFTIFGFNNGLVKYISRYRVTKQTKRLNEIIKIAFIYGVLFSIIGATLLFLLKDIVANNVFKDSGLVNCLIYGSWLIIPLTLIKIFNGLYRGFKQLQYPIISNEIIRRIVFSTIIIIFAFLNFKNTPIVIISSLFAQILVVFYLIGKVSTLKIDFKNILLIPIDNTLKEKKVKKEFFIYSSTLILISFMSVILHRIDKVMLGIYITSEVVGIYSIASTVAGLITFLFVSSNMIFSSIISELYSINKIKILGDLYSTITKWIIIFTLPIFITILFFPDTIMKFFGQAYTIGSTALVILALGQMINVFVGANGPILSMCGHEKLLLINNISMAIINVSFNAILIPKIGILGAALSTGTSIAIINIIKVFEVKFLLGIIPYNKEYFLILFNLLVICLSSLIAKIYWNNIVSVIIITVINMGISIFISYKFKSNLDEIMFNKFKLKLKVMLAK
jgi:O-antigen/teichoic acid export membrane protein